MNINSPETKELVRKAFPQYNGRRISVQPFVGPIRLESYWSGGTRDYYALVSLVPGIDLAANVPENGTPFTPDLKPLEVLPANGALVCYTMGSYEHVTIYVNAENLSKMLPAPVELSRDEKIVLAATAGLKSSYAGIKNYRFHEATERTGIALQNWDAAKAALVSRGLLNKAGAITDAGRNAIGNTRLDNL